MDMDDGHSRSDSRGGHGDALLDTLVALRHEGLFEALAAPPVGMGLLDVGLRWVSANSAFRRTTGLLPQARRRLALQEAAAERIGTTLDVDITCIELAEFTVPAIADLTIVEMMPYELADRGQGGVGIQPEAPRMRRTALACAPALR